MVPGDDCADGVVWCGVVWRGADGVVPVVWCGVVWRGADGVLWCMLGNW